MKAERQIDKKDFPSNKALKEKLLFILKYAVLAPSTHNSQPWLFKVSENKIEVFFEESLKLKYADPLSRDLYISIGCAVENIIISAKYFNLNPSLKFTIEEKTNLCATINFFEGNFIDNTIEGFLLEAILKRVNARGFFEDTPVPQDLIDNIYKKINQKYLTDIKINFFNNKDLLIKIAKATDEGVKKAYKSKNFRIEMSNWMNSNLSRKLQGIPGYALKMPLILSLIIPILIRFVDIGKKLGSLNFKSITSAPLMCSISTLRQDPENWIKVGRVFQRLSLEFVSEDYFTSVFVASIEMETLDAYLKNKLEDPQFLFIIGKPKSLVKTTPRHNVKSKLLYEN